MVTDQIYIAKSFISVTKSDISAKRLRAAKITLQRIYSYTYIYIFLFRYR